MAEAEGILYEEEAGVARITLSWPRRKNALDPAGWQALLATVERARSSSARVVVVTGAGGAFCAGGDLKTIEDRLAMPFDDRRAQLAGDAQAIRALVGLGRPTVALVDGPAAGAGLSLALACDVRLASSRSVFSAAFRKVGLAGDFGVSWLLPRVVGRGRALDLMYSGDTFSAAEAQALGLVERVFADDTYAADCAAYVARLAEGPASLSILRGVIDEVAPLPFADAIEREAQGQAEASRTADATEGARAFLEKRTPLFRGR